jgi:hypothetical protein
MTGGHGRALARIAPAAAVALACLAPFARGIASGASLYFRDLSLQFFPLRRFVAEGLRAGQLRYWNPYAFEGSPSSMLPLGYPVDLLHALWPDERFFSLLLIAHVPLAGLGAFALCRRLGTTRTGAAACGCAFALGGFALSTLNLYVYVQALAWVPLFVLALGRAAAGGRRDVAAAAVAGGLLLSTTAIEFAAQAVAAGVLLALPARGARLARLAAALVLSAGLAAFVLAPLAALVDGSARGAGFPTDVALAHSVHPFALLQVVVAGLFGDTSRFAERFWGMNFFPRGFPYILSLYCGATGLALAATGALERRPPARRLLAFGALALVVCLGTWSGLEGLVDALAPLRRVRFPVKAFLSVQLAAALLAAFAVDALRRGEARALGRFAGLSAFAGLLVAAAPTLALRVPASASFLLGGLFPPDMGWPMREACARAIAEDALRGGAVALAASAVALAVRAQRLQPRMGAAAIVALLAADLLRAGAGLNPMVGPALVVPSPEAVALAQGLRSGRVYPIDPSYSPAYFSARALRGQNHELWSFALLADTFAPDLNLRTRVATALTTDRTMLVPAERVTAPQRAGPDAAGGLLPRLQAAAVSHVVSLDPLGPPFVLERTMATARLDPLAVHVYRVPDPRPLIELVAAGGAAGRVLSLDREGDRLDLALEMERGGRVLIREALGRGWSATVDGSAATIEPAEAHYVALRVPAGRHLARLRYQPPLLLAGLAVTALSLLVTLWLALERPTAAEREAA